MPPGGLACTDEGARTPLVFIHGFPLARGAWAAQVAAFRGTHRVIAPDLRGFGESAPPTGPVTMDSCADDILALLESRTTGPVVLAGHSMGGYIALAFARRYPAMLRGLVLAGTRSGPDTPEGAAGRRATAETVRAQGIGVVVDAMAPKMLAADNNDADLTARVRGLMMSASPAGVVAALLGMAERPDATPGLAAVAVPTLVITSAEDLLIPAPESEKMAAAIPGATLKILPRGGHLFALERAEDFNRALRDWLAVSVRTG